jgi:hypothetical protein
MQQTGIKKFFSSSAKIPGPGKSPLDSTAAPTPPGKKRSRADEIDENNDRDANVRRDSQVCSSCVDDLDVFEVCVFEFSDIKRPHTQHA